MLNILGCEWTESAPYRTICVRDALADLPEIKNGWNRLEMPYDAEAVSHFQKMMRGNFRMILHKYIKITENISIYCVF